MSPLHIKAWLLPQQWAFDWDEHRRGRTCELEEPPLESRTPGGAPEDSEREDDTFCWKA